MAYQVLARKWRPQEFGALIGQQAVVTALQNAVREDRIAQAYLFSGIRGVGKTTAARLFAKALNCEKEPELRPCNDCATCAEITSGADMDVLEIDAATYSKVEQVRELAESLQYGPARDRYKVVVLDEVHRLSRQAFDALLKIVEEPPPRLVFIFATTEIDSVPATILSRCQEYHFRRVGAADVVAHLEEICAEEGIEASTHSLRLLARAGEGSVRDAVALLDQLATFGNNKIEEAEARRLVGGLDLALFSRLLTAILAGDSPTVSALAREVEAAGWDPRQVYSHFLGYCRDALHLALDGDAASLELPDEEAAALATTARDAGYENLLRLLHQLLGSESTVRRSDAGGLALELAWLRAAELPKLISIERVLAGAAPLPAAGAAPAERPRRESSPAPAAAATGAARRERPAAPAAETPEPEPVAEPEAEPVPSEARTAPRAARSQGAEAGLERFREELAVRRPMLAAQLAHARLEFADGELAISLPASEPLVASQLARPANRERLDAAVVGAFGAGSRWRIVDGGGKAKSKTETERPSADEEQQERDAAAADPRVQAVLDIFGGEIAAVAPGEDASSESDDGDDSRENG